MSERQLRQQSTNPTGSAPPGASVSADNAASVAETARLQGAAQDRINAGRTPGIGDAA
jgi:hypothetical protein